MITDNQYRRLMKLSQTEKSLGVAAAKAGGGRLGGEVRCAGVAVSPGDAVIADEDGVVVWPADRIEELLGLARKRLESDLERQAAIAAGGDLD